MRVVQQRLAVRLLQRQRSQKRGSHRSSQQQQQSHQQQLILAASGGLFCSALYLEDSSIQSPAGSWFPLLRRLQSNTSCQEDNSQDDLYSEPFRFQQCLEYHQSQDYAERWDYANPLSRVPTTSDFPKNVPTRDEISMLEYDFPFSSGKYRNDLQFRLACYYLFVTSDNTSRGLSLLQQLALSGHADAMCLFGIVWNEGRFIVEADPRKACMWFRKAANMGHEQACYELGVALYTGEGLAENEVEAVEFFEQAASMGHASAAYMLGDCLLDGVGVIRDRAEALEWLVAAAELGHRGARSRVLAVLQCSGDAGVFSDSSRQSFRRDNVNDVPEQKKWTEEDLQRLVTLERKYSIGGGSRNPVVLRKRKTVVLESRDTENKSRRKESDAAQD